MTLLSMDDINVGYDHTQILWDVSLAIESGEIVSLIGRNGVGKTTLMKTVIGELPPMTGTIAFQDEEITEYSADKRARAGIGYVPQNRNVFPNLTVEENLQIGELINQNQNDTRYDEVYSYFPRLEERQDQKAGTMSGGEQQMLTIGRALVGNPDLLLLDEPSEGVQPSIVEDIAETVKKINKQLGTTIFFAEQNIEFTTYTSERSYVMEKGHIVEKVSAHELQDSESVQEYIRI